METWFFVQWCKLPSDQRRVIEQAKLNNSPFGKALEKQTETSEGQRKKQIKSIENHGKQLINSNELTKKNFISTVAAYQLKNRKRFNETVEERFSKFRNLEKLN